MRPCFEAQVQSQSEIVFLALCLADTDQVQSFAACVNRERAFCLLETLAPFAERLRFGWVVVHLDRHQNGIGSEQASTLELNTNCATNRQADRVRDERRSNVALANERVSGL